MSEWDMGGYTSPTERIYGNLSYEQILARAVDRCLHYRVIDPERNYVNAVRSLHLSLVDLPGKKMRSFTDNEEKNIMCMPDITVTQKMDKLFSSITKTLCDSKMLFRSVLVETGREQVR